MSNSLYDFDEDNNTFLQGSEAVSKLSSALQAEVNKLLQPGEIVENIEQPIFWQANGSALVVSGLGTLALIICAIFFRNEISLSVWVLLLCFPVALIVSIYGYWRIKNSFTVFTNTRIITKPAFGKIFSVNYKDITAVSLETNYLHCRKELNIRRFIPEEGRPKVSYIEAIPTIEKYEKLISLRIEQKPVQEGNTFPETVVLQ